MALERLQKILAAAGFGSRRACEQFIVQGRVTVDRSVADQLGAKADPDKQDIRFDGEPVRPQSKLYFLVNKPRGYISTSRDERGRPRVLDLLPVRETRLFTVGRLDAATEGLVIVTNDGAFTQRVAHPRYGVAKTYVARVEGELTNVSKRELMTGVWLEGHRCLATSVRIARRAANESIVELTIHEGRNREVRRMFAKLGHRVRHLVRTRIGPIEDKALPSGRCRKLQPDEIKALLDAAAGPSRKAPRHSKEMESE